MYRQLSRPQTEKSKSGVLSKNLCKRGKPQFNIQYSQLTRITEVGAARDLNRSDISHFPYRRYKALGLLRPIGRKSKLFSTFPALTQDLWGISTASVLVLNLSSDEAIHSQLIYRRSNFLTRLTSALGCGNVLLHKFDELLGQLPR